MFNPPGEVIGDSHPWGKMQSLQAKHPDARAELQEMSGYEQQSDKNPKQFVLLEHMVGLRLCAGTSHLLQKH